MAGEQLMLCFRVFSQFVISEKKGFL